ncbi:ABC transporter permease [Lujinxingia sediminis]|uniref:ABC transporter permease n=1 Tax=Lujinxingia sediminis TaxID=2480984 RepID=A0ABY0CTQ0_9DELT|nr:FtsX-like permease family protein [Lujinxingia sediminis]RVU44827.1 ABC transporter permease [Lujinxingia sediminis]
MWKIAWRNLWRNRTRTVIIASAIAFSFGLMLISMGISADSYARMEEKAREATGGSVLVHGAGWWEGQGSDVVVADPGPVMVRAEGLPEVKAVMPRVIINGLLSSARGNEAVRLSGVVLEREQPLADLRDDLVEGAFFSREYDAPVVISEGLANRLNVSVGDKVVLTASRVDGEVTRALFYVSGLLRSGMAGEADLQAYAPLEVAQEAVGMGDALTQVGVLVSEVEAQDEVIAALQQVEGAQALEVLSWEQAVPEMSGLLEFDAAVNGIYFVVIFLIVLFAIANTFLMAVMERVREYGLLSALGVGPGQVGWLVIWEALYLALVGMFAGFVLGIAGHLTIAQVGIDMAAMGVGDMEMAGIAMNDLVVRSHLEPGRWLLASAMVLAVVMISAVYPAVRAMRLAPSQAMRFYE